MKPAWLGRRGAEKGPRTSAEAAASDGAARPREPAVTSARALQSRLWERQRASVLLEPGTAVLRAVHAFLASPARTW